jgi:hypothetical protein
VLEAFNSQVKVLAGPLLREVKELASKGGKLLENDVGAEMMESAKKLGLSDEIAVLKKSAQDALNNPG